MKKVWSAAVALILGLNNSAYAYAASQSVTDDYKVVHVINRLTFGPAPGDIENVRAMGVQGFIEQQLNPSSLPESQAVDSLLSISPTARQRNEELAQRYNVIRKARQEVRNAETLGRVPAPEYTQYSNLFGYDKVVSDQRVTLKLTRAVESPRQLQEVMTEFWFNHFNVCESKDVVRVLAGPYEEQAIRPFAMGKFRDLVWATCHHPAMLYYLDNWENTAPGTKGARGRFKGLNENYARELMELHTLGVDGGYSQKDVIQLARILTGLGIASNPRQMGQLQQIGNLGAYFDPNRHDFGDKILLGQHISGSGEPEVEQALDLLCRHPATAHHISYQLAQYFVCDNPPASLVNKVAATFTQTDGDIKAVLRELFYSAEFGDPKYENAKYKTPFRYVVSSLRATGAVPTDFKNIGPFLSQNGEPLYRCLTPDGYKNTQEAWLNPDGLLNRISFATAISSGRMKNVLPVAPEYRQLGATISDSKFSTQTVQAVLKAPPALKSAAVLGCPEFMCY